VENPQKAMIEFTGQKAELGETGTAASEPGSSSSEPVVTKGPAVTIEYLTTALLQTTAPPQATTSEGASTKPPSLFTQYMEVKHRNLGMIK